MSVEHPGDEPLPPEPDLAENSGEAPADDEPVRDGPVEEGQGDAPEPAPEAAPAEEPAEQSAGESPADAPQADLPTLEAMLFSTHHPLTAGRLAELLALPTTKPVRDAIKSLNSAYQQTGRSFRIEQVAGGYQMLTLPEFGDALKKLHAREEDAKLSKAAIETLTIIAYRQPVLRADVEAVRGVSCGETIRSLMEKRLVKIAGRAELPGRPMLYGTTKRFLEVFGLNNLKELPQPAER